MYHNHSHLHSFRSCRVISPSSLNYVSYKTTSQRMQFRLPRSMFRIKRKTQQRALCIPTRLFKTHGHNPRLLVRSIGFVSVPDSHKWHVGAVKRERTWGEVFQSTRNAAKRMALTSIKSIRPLSPTNPSYGVRSSKCSEDITAGPQFLSVEHQPLIHLCQGDVNASERVNKAFGFVREKLCI